ncbi:MAG: tetratricopeptide repeat protein, partial [Planctomycetota bacterium]
ALPIYDLALPPQEAALATRRAELGDEDLDTLESIRSLSGLLRRRDEFDRAEPLLAEALEGFRKVCGDEDPRTLECLHMVAVLRGAQGRTAEELEAYQTALPRFREILGEEHRDTLELMGNYGSALMGAGRLEEAEKLLVEAHAKLARGGMDTRRAITATNNLGTLNVRLNRLDEAERLYRQSLAGLRRTFGDWHPNTISNVENIAGLLSRRQQTEEAKVLMAEVLERRRLLFGDGDLQTLRSVHNMAVLNRDEKDDAAAEAGFREAYEGFSRLLGPDRPDTLYIASSLARVLRYQRKLEEAEGLYRLILQSRMRSPGPAHPSTLDTVVDLANVLGERGRTEDALRLMQEHEPGARTVYSGPRQRQLGDYLSLLGDAYAKADRFREGEAVSSEARSMLTRSYGEASDAVTRCVDRQIALLRRWELAEPSRGHQAKADALIEETLALFTRELEKARRGNPSDSPALASALAGVGARLLTFGRFAEAEPLLREAFTIREAALPDDWLTFNASSLLGGTLLGLARYTDAEPLLVNGYEGLEAREKSIPRQLEYCLDDAIERLVQLYTETGTPEVAERWRSRRVTLTIK